MVIINSIISLSTTEGVFKEENLDKFQDMYSGNNTSIGLKWDKINGAKSYAIFMIDFEGSNIFASPFIHWSVANISDNFLDVNASKNNKNIAQGHNSLESKILKINHDPELKWKYLGPAPKDISHNYEIIIFALNKNVIKMKTGFNIYSFFQLNSKKIIGTGRKTFLAKHPLEKNKNYVEFYKYAQNANELKISYDSIKKNSVEEILKNIKIRCLKKDFFTIVILNYFYVNQSLGMPKIEFLASNLKNYDLLDLSSKEVKKLQLKSSKPPTSSSLHKNLPVDSFIEVRVFQHDKIHVEQDYFFKNVYKKLHGKVISEYSVFI